MDASPRPEVDFVIVDVQTLPSGALLALAVHLLRRAGPRDTPAAQVALSAWRLRRVTDYAQAHLDEALTITMLAAVAGLSPRHFARAFTREVGETPRRWLLKRRIDKAKRCLADSDETLAQIAYACGFAAQSHFSRAFRRMTGESPRRWRQWHKKS
jgi:AraC family transcriptional regulator